MKLAALCCTYQRAHLLGQLIESFRRQDYPAQLRELIILDDAGQYGNQQGDGWRLISIPCRFASLGEKRNACAALASPDVEGFLIADDDDIYLPHWFRTHAEALRQAEWSRPSLVYLERSGRLEEYPTDGIFHGGWAYRREAFHRVRGYSPRNNGEDQDIAHRMQRAGVTQCNPTEFSPVFYIYREHNESYHLSDMGEHGYEELARQRQSLCKSLPIGWPIDYTALPVRKLSTVNASSSR
jgi:hypothetical protein